MPTIVYIDVPLVAVSQPEAAQCCGIIDSFFEWRHSDCSKMAGTQTWLLVLRYLYIHIYVVTTHNSEAVEMCLKKTP